MHLGQLLRGLAEHVECSGYPDVVLLFFQPAAGFGKCSCRCTSEMLSYDGRSGKKPRTDNDDLSLQVLRNVKKKRGQGKRQDCRAVKERIEEDSKVRNK
jgi:hypothetical protein